MPRPLTEIISEIWREGNMPSIKRQAPPQPTTAFPNGSVLATAVPVSTIREEHVKVCLYGRNRCLSGDTPIRYTIHDEEGRPQNGKGGTLELLFKRFNGVQRFGKGYYQRPQTVNSLYYVSSVTDEGRVFQNHIEGVTDSGRNEVFRVTTASGKCIKATADHRFLTELGYVELSGLTVGSELMVNPRKRRYKGGTKPRVRRKEVFVKNHAGGRMKVVNGCVYYRLRLTYAVYEAHKNGMTLQDYISLLNRGGPEEVNNLWHVPKGAEIHHLDENPLNDEISNLFLTASGGEHQRTFHHDAIRDRFSIYAELDPVVSIEKVGTENTYDIQAAAPYHNFEAGGILVHNSGKITTACQFPKPALIISCEPDENTGGCQSVANIPNVVITRVTPPNKPLPGEKVRGSAKVVAIANELAVKNPFRTVILKTATSLQDIILVEIMGLPKVPELMSWGMVPDGVYQQRAEKLRETIRPLRDLNNCHVIVLAQEKDHNAPEERGGKSKILHTMQQGSFMAPALGATNATWLQDACGYVFQIYEDEVMQEIVVPMHNPDGTPAAPVIQHVGTGKRARHLRLLYHPNFAAGGKWEFTRGFPEFVTAPTPEELYAAMAAYIPALR